MVFFIFLIYGIILFQNYQKYRFTYSARYLYLFPLILFWTLVIGGQYYVGTDYNSYLEIFKSTDSQLLYFKNKGEILFYYLVKLSHAIGLRGQAIFFIFAFLNVYLYLKIDEKLKIDNHSLFFFLFITVSTLFHSQMNGIRQCLAVYLITIALLNLYQSKSLKFFICLFLAAGFHISSLAILPLYFFRNLKLNATLIRIIIIVSTILSFLSFDELLKSLIIYVPHYAHYVDSEYFNQDISLINKLTKLTTLPFYYISTILLSKGYLKTNYEYKLYIWGVLTYCLKLLCLISPVTYRLSYFFFIFSIIPLYFILIYLKNKNHTIYNISLVYILLTYLIKILLFPTGEYSYSSILSTWI